ncbi:unnamed protein product [Clonostachys solani]|uniref:1-alkyl-2-acetylglycerophosphocholine esterase n=1 Tax=Clonostachys solani TaxID=160281 RepID=A0A9P0ER93_9HYPO|nr:unnamed protein product [Clonostachys solani]
MVKAQFRSTVFLFLGLWLAPNAYAEPIPTPSGKYNVGIQRHLVPFINKNDPTWPNEVSTEYLVTLYYPTPDEAAEPSPYIEPELAQLYTDFSGWNFSHLTSTMRKDASFLPKPAGPTLLFGPSGWGPSTDGDGILLSELASHGYVIAALDHIFEQPFLRLPNGTGIYGLAIDFNGDLEYIQALHEVRVREMVHFAGFLPKLAAKLHAPFKTDKLGAFGHSLGGSSSLNAALETDKIAAAINMDGTNFGRLNTTSDSLNKPSLLLGFDGHTPEIDDTWENFFKSQKGWWRLFTVTDAKHNDWTDMAFWKKWGTTRPLGAIDGDRMVALRNRYVKAFFDEHLLGKDDAVLDGPSEDWPEVNYIQGNQ